MGCWWRWEVPGLSDPICLATDSPAELMHCVRESMRKTALRDLEERRPRQFGGMGGRVAKALVLDYLARLEKPVRWLLLMGCLSGAVWTAERAYRRRLRHSPQCPYCGSQAWQRMRTTYSGSARHGRTSESSHNES